MLLSAADCGLLSRKIVMLTMTYTIDIQVCCPALGWTNTYQKVFHGHPAFIPQAGDYLKPYKDCGLMPTVKWRSVDLTDGNIYMRCVEMIQNTVDATDFTAELVAAEWKQI